MKRSKTTYLIFTLIFLVIVIVIAQVSKDDSSPLTSIKQVIMRQTTPSPTPNQEGVSIVGTNLTNEPLDEAEEIEIQLSKPIEEDGFTIEIEPKVRVLYLLDPTRTKITIRPTPNWETNTVYYLKILKSPLKPMLSSDYEFSFKIQPAHGI